MDGIKVNAELIASAQPDLLVEAYLDAKYYQCNPHELESLLTVFAASEALVQEDAVLTLVGRAPQEGTIHVCASIDDNFHEFENACPKPHSADSNAINSKWLEHHQEGHLVKAMTCPVCHRRKHGDRQHGMIHLNLRTFEVSTDEHQYCLVAVVSIEVDNEFLPSSCVSPEVAVTTLPARTDPYIKYWAQELQEFKLMEVVSSTTKSSKTNLCLDRNIVLTFSPVHQPSSKGIAKRRV